MVEIQEVISRVRFWRGADRLGPDIPYTHWRLYFRSSMEKLCRDKFKDFGNGAEFRPGAYAEACSKISIGDNVVIRPGTFLFADPTDGGGGILIEEKVLLGCGVHMYTNNHAFSDINKPIFDQGYPPSTSKNSIILRRGCWIGAGAIILAGVEIGCNAVVGAGSIVTRSVPSHSVAVGNPAVVIKKLDLSR